MTMQLELWHLISLLLAFFGATAGMGKVILEQIERRITERFNSHEEIERSFMTLSEERLSRLEQADRNLEREVMSMKADLPLAYVRREDFVRNQSVIEAKLDGLALRIENLTLRGRNDG